MRMDLDSLSARSANHVGSREVSWPMVEQERTTAPAVSAGAGSCAGTQRSLRLELLLDHAARFGVRRRDTKGDPTPDMPKRYLRLEGAGAGPGEGRPAKGCPPSVQDVERDRRRFGHGEV